MGRTSHVNVKLRKLFSLGTDPEPVNLGRGEGRPMCVWVCGGSVGGGGGSGGGSGGGEWDGASHPQGY